MKLYGIALSNYTNMVKHALLEKGIPFEMVPASPSQDPAFLAKSPMGKVPLLETDAGFLTETDVIMAYLEESFPEKKLFPEQPFARAKVKQLMKTQELYVETPMHGTVGVLFGREIPSHVLEAVPKQTRRGLAALSGLVKFTPFIAGDRLTFADIFVFYSFMLSNRLAQQVYQWNLLDEMPGLSDWYDMMSQREVSKRVAADMAADMKK
ncbi:MAG: glutathione S-transferase family protein [Pseudomonadales bacterium]|nr:glutathione S-transferase family protein [Pseudomonadales bacterium]